MGDSADAGGPSSTAFHNLTVHLIGDGSGRVTSTPAGIDCPSTCEARFPDGERVTLEASATDDSRFYYWVGGCGPMAIVAGSSKAREEAKMALSIA